MARNRYGQKQSNPIFRWLYLILFSITSIWLITSIITKKSPLEVLSSFFSSLPNPGQKDRELLILQKDSLITDLEEKLEACQGLGKYKRGLCVSLRILKWK